MSEFLGPHFVSQIEEQHWKLSGISIINKLVKEHISDKKSLIAVSVALGVSLHRAESDVEEYLENLQAKVE